MIRKTKWQRIRKWIIIAATAALLAVAGDYIGAGRVVIQGFQTPDSVAVENPLQK